VSGAWTVSIAIKKPKKSGSAYYNYKDFFSIVLLGLVDAEYKFLWANVGAEGSASDYGVFNRSSLEDCLRDETLVLPLWTLFVTVWSSYDHCAAPIRLISHRAAPVRCLNKNRTGAARSHSLSLVSDFTLNVLTRFFHSTLGFSKPN